MSVISTWNSGIIQDQVSHVINRAAIDSSGSLGSLYDGHRDLILGTLNVNRKENMIEKVKSRKCFVITGKEHLQKNILKEIGVENELRVSLLSNLTEKKGIAAIHDYPLPINEYTRIFHYYHCDREEKLSEYPAKKNQSLQQLSKDQTVATHIITGISIGIAVIIVLQPPADNKGLASLDNVLNRMCTSLLTDDNTLKLDSTEESLLKNIADTKVYSNTSDLRNIAKFYDICKHIKLKQNNPASSPISYVLQPIKSLYPTYSGQGVTFISLPESIIDKIEEYVLQTGHYITKLKILVTDELPKLLNGHLKEQLFLLKVNWSNTQKKYNNEVEHLSKLMIDVRRGRISPKTFDQTLSTTQKVISGAMIRGLAGNLNELKEKGHFISDLERQQFRYLNVADHDIDRTDNEKTIERKLITNDQQDRVLCSNDSLNSSKPVELYQLRQEVTKERTNNSDLRLTYADFSYSSYELKHMITLPSNKHTNVPNYQKPIAIISSSELQATVSSSTKVPANILNDERLSSNMPTNTSRHSITQLNIPFITEVQIPDSKPPKKYTSPQVPSDVSNFSPLSNKVANDATSQAKTKKYIPASRTTYSSVTTLRKPETLLSTEFQVSDSSLEKKYFPIASTLSLLDNETINIVLIGETGVGKSTFINALANYLTFHTLEEARTTQPVVLIPVSFLITTGDDFQEHIIKFGEVDDSNNEDFDHPGQSVTQHCKSYLFHLKNNHGKKLRIIDTPGFGDTRGIQQDDQNIQHILQYINNLSHLNAICFLLKPNESRLNIFFRSCFTQLFSFLNQKALKNIIFCFTNSRSTFYTPGNTAPLLKKMISSLSIGDVPFNKENTFCFDNEAFRYLVALQNGIKFTYLDEEEYLKSWTKSMTESRRLADYICEKLTSINTQQK